MSDASDTLRRSATVLKECAEATTTGVWQEIHDSDPESDEPDDSMVVSLREAGTDEITGSGMLAADANYIARMDPTVGLALADWLSNCADRMPYSDRHTPEQAHALAVARAILREDE